MFSTDFSEWPSFTKEEAEAVSSVLLSNRVNYWTGQEGRKFEKEFSAWCGANHAIALANGTVALELALKVLEIGAGDEVIVTPRTFIASVSCIVSVGATPVFADVNPDSGNITAENIASVLSPNTKAIICVHLAGWPCDMDSIMELASQNDIKVIEDCAQAHGASYKGRPVGSLGDIAAWSFCQDKIMTTGGEGGMLTTNDPELWEKAWSYKDHGKSWDAIYNREHPPGFRWVHESWGTNWRMTEMQAVIGRLQLKKMNAWHYNRLQNASRILEAAQQHDSLRVPIISESYEHAWYKCYVYVRPEMLKKGWNRDKIIEEIIAQGVACYPGSCSEVYLEKAFENSTYRPRKRLPVAKELGETSLMFLVHPTLSHSEIDKTCFVFNKVMIQATL